MKFLVTGGTGFIGSALVARLIYQGEQVTVLTRNAGKAKQSFPADVVFIESLDQATPVDVVINLAGEPLFSHRWNPDRKKRLIDSRVDTTQALVEWMKTEPPRTFLSGSAIGFYGDKGNQDVTEQSEPGSDFASMLVQQWENAALEAADFGVRVCLLRTGLVVGPQGGFLQQLIPLYRMCLGGALGQGDQWMSWIHLDDMLGLIEHCYVHDIQGAINCTAPNPVTSNEFSQCLGKVLQRPAILKTPGFMLRLVVGESAYMLLTGQKVLPALARKTGYDFKHAILEKALRDVV